MTDRIDVRVIAGRDDQAAYVSIINATTPEEPTSAERLDWEDATYPGGVRLLGLVGDRVVGAAGVGRMFVYPPDYEGLWSTVGVVPEARRQGVGERLLRMLQEEGSRRGKRWLETGVSAVRVDAIDFLEHRGFTEVERSREVRLDLPDLEPSDIPALDGVRLTTLAEQPDLLGGVYDVAVLAFPDIPGGDRPMAPGDLAEFRARDVDRIPGWAFIVAQETDTGRVVGYASLSERDDHSGVYWHDMTAVAPDWRGRGIATAMKIATIRAAIEHGAVALETGNDVANAPMRAVNARLGYRPLPDLIWMRGPVATGIMSS